MVSSWRSATLLAPWRILICLANGGVPILRRRWTGLLWRTPKGAQDCFVSPQAAPLTAHNRERNHGNLHLTCELHRPRNPQDQGFPETSGCLQRDGEKVRSDREGRILDTGILRRCRRCRGAR